MDIWIDMIISGIAFVLIGAGGVVRLRIRSLVSLSGIGAILIMLGIIGKILGLH